MRSQRSPLCMKRKRQASERSPTEPSRYYLQIGVENVKRMCAEPRLGKANPTVLPDSAGVVEKRLQLPAECGGALRRWRCDARCSGRSAIRECSAAGRSAYGRADDDGLKFIFAAGSGVRSDEWKLIDWNRRAMWQAQRLRWRASVRIVAIDTSLSDQLAHWYYGYPVCPSDVDESVNAT